jgi:hypothetical protein
MARVCKVELYMSTINRLQNYLDRMHPYYGELLSTRNLGRPDFSVDDLVCELLTKEGF